MTAAELDHPTIPPFAADGPDRDGPFAAGRGAAGWVLARPFGDIDSASVWRFRQLLAELPFDTVVVIDMGAVTFMDSAGLGALIGAVRRARDSGGQVRLAAARPMVRRLLATTGIDRLVELYPAVAEALQV